jgi:histidinol-phosphatase (PHP family)
MRLFNSHCHTHNSIDCAADPDEMCQAAVRAGVSGLAFCDHCHGGSFITYNTYDVLKKSHADAAKMATKYQDCLQVFKGAEFDEILWTPDYIDRLIKSFQFDIILASVHRIKNAKDSNYISRVDFNKFTRDELCDFVSGYFDEVLKTAQTADFDALAHLTLIIRYVTGKYKIEINLADYMPQIDKILQVIINTAPIVVVFHIISLNIQSTLKIMTAYT